MAGFYFCHSPFAVLPKGGEGFIYHFDKPRFFAILTAFGDDSSFEDQNYSGYNIIFQYNRSDGYSQFYILQVIQNIDKASVKMPQALFQAAAWYCRFRDKTDQKAGGTKSSWSYLQDFSILTKGLQILRLPKQKKFLISFAGGIKTVHSDEALDIFLSKDLGYNELALEQGIVNSV